MGKVLGLLFSATVAAIASPLCQAATLARDGAPAAVIVIPKNPRPVEKYAAEELARFVKRASGAELKIGNAPVEGFDTVFIGRAVKIRKWGGINRYEPNGGFIEIREHEIDFVGGDSDDPIDSEKLNAGSLFAVYEFLERELKVRWLWPDEEIGIVVPPRPTIEVAPAKYGFRCTFPECSLLRAFPRRWALRSVRAHNRNRSFPDAVTGGHVYGRWWKTYGETHPDFFEMNKNGERVIGGSSSMCVSNPAFEQELYRLWKEEKDQNPAYRLDMNLCENDTDGRCQCPSCKAWDDPAAPEGNVSERYARHYLNMYNLMAKDDPDVVCKVNAYKNYNLAPKGFKLPRNIHVNFVPKCHVPYTAEWRAFIHECAKGWRESGCTFNYRPNILDGYAMPFDVSDDIFDEFHQVFDGGSMISYLVDGPNVSFATQGPFLYMLARLAVHPDQPLEEIRAEWFGGFGPAAKAIQGYFDYWRQYILDNADLFCRIPCEKDPISHAMIFGWHFAYYAHILYPPEAFAKAEPFLAAAREAAKDSPDDLKRVEFIAVGFEHAKLCAATCAVFADKEATADEKIAAYEKVRLFREAGMPQWAVNLKNCTGNQRNESVAWTLPQMDPKRSVALPIDWKFHLDTEDKGEGLGWWKPDFDDSQWGTAKTDRHLERQGYTPGWLHAWFRLEFTVPEQFRGATKAIFHFGALDKTCRFWINGKLAGKFDFNPETHPNSWSLPMEFDITKFMPEDGKLSIAVKVTSTVGAGGIVKPCYLVFPNAENLRVGFGPGNPPPKKSFYSYGDTCCVWEDCALRFAGGDKPKAARYVLDHLKSPANKCLRTTVEYSRSGAGALTFIIEEYDLATTCIRRTPIELAAAATAGGPPKDVPTGGPGAVPAEKSVTIVKDVNVKSEAVRVNLRMESALEPGATAEVKSMNFELLPLWTP